MRISDWSSDVCSSDLKVAAIIDLDPQATASFWKVVRQLDTPAVASIQPVRLPAMLKPCEDAGTDLVVIDGAAVARDVAYEAARQPAFILIPTHPAVFHPHNRQHTPQCGHPAPPPSPM